MQGCGHYVAFCANSDDAVRASPANQVLKKDKNDEDEKKAPWYIFLTKFSNFTKLKKCSKKFQNTFLKSFVLSKKIVNCKKFKNILQIFDFLVE